MASRLNYAHVMLVAVFLTGAAAMATAQPLFTNPPCPNVRIINNGPCPAQLNLVPVPPGWPPAIVVPPGAIMPFPVAGPVVINGITSFGGVFYGFNPPIPPAGVACAPNTWWISNVTLGPPPGCCFDICIDPCACVIILSPTAAPPPCNP